MRIVKAAFSKTFPISQYYEKVFLEAELNEGDDVRQVLYDLKRQVQSFFYESNAAAEKQMGTVVTEISKKEEIIFNQEWEDVKAKLLSFDDPEEAQSYLNTTSYSMTVEAKQIINSLKNKNAEPKY